MRRLIPLLLLSACAAPQAPLTRPPAPQPAAELSNPAFAPGGWAQAVLPADRQRLLGVDEAWYAALGAVRRGGYGAELAALSALAEERAGLPAAEPPPGLYRCRTIKLGGLPYVAYPWFRCRVARTDEGLRFDKLTGSQRQSGRLYPDGERRMVFLGAIAWGDTEAAAPAYGVSAERDQVGFLERVGPQRWRLALPFPRQESLLDLIELTPEA